jgi:hypothetical protein
MLRRIIQPVFPMSSCTPVRITQRRKETRIYVQTNLNLLPSIDVMTEVDLKPYIEKGRFKDDPEKLKISNMNKLSTALSLKKRFSPCNSYTNRRPLVEGIPVNHPLFAIFYLADFSKMMYKFLGWYKITKVIFLAPDSKAVTDKLDNPLVAGSGRETQQHRDRKSRKHSMINANGKPVIVVREDEKAMQEMGVPNVPSTGRE